MLSHCGYVHYCTMYPCHENSVVLHLCLLSAPYCLHWFSVFSPSNYPHWSFCTFHANHTDYSYQCSHSFIVAFNPSMPTNSVLEAVCIKAKKYCFWLPSQHCFKTYYFPVYFVQVILNLNFVLKISVPCCLFPELFYFLINKDTGHTVPLYTAHI